MDAIGCVVLPKTPVSAKVSPELLTNLTFPAPCVLVGRGEFSGVYFFVGLLLPFILMTILKFDHITACLCRMMHGRRPCSCRTKRRLSDADDQDPQDVLDERSSWLHSKESHDEDMSIVKRVQQLHARKSKRWRLRTYINEAAIPQTSLGQAWMLCAVICGAVNFVIYLHTASLYNQTSLEFCHTLPNFKQIVDFMANSFLLIYFSIRLIGNDRRVTVIWNLHAVGDYFNVPACFMDLLLNRSFLGFGFLRIYAFMWLAELLANRGILSSTNRQRLSRLFIMVFSVMIIATGFLHLIENVGDPFLYEDDGTELFNGQSIVFWRCFLYIYGRVTLLDLSGMRLYTIGGRIIIYAFQVVALGGIIGKAIPQIVHYLKVKKEYEKSFKSSSAYLHVVVTGHINSSAMSDFLKEFYHSERQFNDHFRIVLLSKNPPDADMLQLLERYYPRLEYKTGSVMNLTDLKRVDICEAAAVLILADKGAVNADADDAGNLMRVVSIKNFKPDIRVIVQLAHHHNKAYLQNIGSWSPANGDTIICIAELGLGLLAQSCLAPGFSTLMANLFNTRSYQQTKRKEEAWMSDYNRGAAQELYYRKFSQFFHGMTFTEACHFCYTRLHVVLLALQPLPHDMDSFPIVNSGDELRISEDTLGFFLADHREEVDRVVCFCRHCHLDVELHHVIACQCAVKASNVDVELLSVRRSIKRTQDDQQVTNQDEEMVEAKVWSYIYADEPDHKTDGQRDFSAEQDQEDLFDSSGMFHWVSSRPLHSVLLSRSEAARRKFSGHIVLCLLTEAGAQPIGLANFVLPLRSSSIPKEELCPILIISDPAYMQKEWQFLKNLPLIYILKGHALNRADLRGASLNTCRTCVIVGAPSSLPAGPGAVDSSLLDKSVLLATSNVRTMRFSHLECLSGVKSTQDVASEKSQSKQRVWATGLQIPIVTDLRLDSNAVFLDDDDEDRPGTEFFLTQPYSSGRAFSSSVLDLLMITSFFNPFLIKALQAIIFGGASQELEQVLSEGIGLIGGPGISRSRKFPNQVRVVRVGLESLQSAGPVPNQADTTLRYGDLFLHALNVAGLVLLGLHRPLRDRANRSTVICNPPAHFPLQQDDVFIGLQRALP